MVVEVIGDFTSPPWRVRMKCQYSYFYGGYGVKATLRNGNRFIFIVNGVH
jgi:hypothetical protein